jgi:hypothetical protein
MTVVTRVSPHVLLNETLDEPDLAGSRLCLAAVATLRYIAEQGGIGLTTSGAFNRKFVVWAVDELDWPGYTAQELAVVCKVLNETDVPPLFVLHELLLAAKLIRHAKGHAVLTRSGREHLDRHGLLQVVLFEMIFTRFDFAGYQRWPVEMPDADLPHVLGVIHRRLGDWVAFPEFTRCCVPVDIFPARWGTAEDNAMLYLAARVVRPLRWLGLVEEREPERRGPLRLVELRKTALFDTFFRFEVIRDDIGRGARH